MKKYRKPDQEYNDEYDRHSIKLLKGLEEEENKRLAKVSGIEMFKERVTMIMMGDSYEDTAVLRHRNKRTFIEKQIQDDEKKDRLVAKTPEPESPRCESCLQRMRFATHFFEDENTRIIFIFECPDGHAPRKGLYADGSVYQVKKTTCIKCGSEKITGKTKRTANKIVITDTCKTCKHKEVFEMTITPDLSIDEADRKKYCLDFIGRKTKTEEIIDFNNVMEEVRQSIKEKETKELLELDKIEKPTIHQLQQKITAKGAEKGFVTLQLDKPEIVKDVLTVGFSMQDSETRKEAESLKEFTAFLDGLLLPTNWRLVKKSAEYRLGYLSAKLQGFESEADLTKIAEEIIKTKNKKSA
ncbi:MAG: hypothetical protein V4539_08780 [Bacteroidota bacterium]